MELGVRASTPIVADVDAGGEVDDRVSAGEHLAPIRLR